MDISLFLFHSFLSSSFNPSNTNEEKAHGMTKISAVFTLNFSPLYYTSSTDVVKGHQTIVVCVFSTLRNNTANVDEVMQPSKRNLRLRQLCVGKFGALSRLPGVSFKRRCVDSVHCENISTTLSL